MSRKVGATGLPIGGPTLLMVFVILCINIFAVISYMSALRDYNLSEKSAEMITKYYEADTKATNVLSDVAYDIKLNTVYENKYKGINDFAILDEVDTLKVKYKVPIKKDIVLSVVVEFPKNSSKYRVLEWKMINNKLIEENDSVLDLPEF